MTPRPPPQEMNGEVEHSPTSSPPARIVVLRALGLGDLCTALPALRALRRHYPEHRLQLAAPWWLTPLAAASGAVHEVVDTGPLQPLPDAVAGAALAVNLHGRGPESTRLLLSCGAREIWAFAHPDVSSDAPALRPGPPWRPGEHEVSRWCRLLRHHGVPADPDDLSLVDQRNAHLRRVEGRPQRCEPRAIVHPGASAPARRWPLDRWTAVARALRDQGWTVIITGNAAEASMAAAVGRGAGLEAGCVRAGATSLRQMMDEVAGADLVVCGDTGVAHLATAYRTPSVILFGPVPPSEWGPRHGPHVALWTGRRGDPHGEVVDAGLLEIGVTDVLGAVDQCLAAAAARQQ